MPGWLCKQDGLFPHLGGVPPQEPPGLPCALQGDGTGHRERSGQALNSPGFEPQTASSQAAGPGSIP